MLPEINLIKFLQGCDEAYYNTEETLVSDTEYDRLKTLAKEKFPDDPYFDTVGTSPLRQKIDLPYVLGSLEKIKLDTIEKWLMNNHVDLVISEKIDGATIFCQYNKSRVNISKVSFAATRGNGLVGTDITQKAKEFCPILFNINPPVELRGEAYLTQQNFELLNEEYFATFGKRYVSKRNAVAGVLNRDDLFGCKYLSTKFYEYVNSTLLTEIERFNRIKEMTFNTPAYMFIPKQDIKKTIDIIVRFLQEAKNKEYLVDGVVITVNESTRENEKYPKNKISFKINEDGIPCTVEKVNWNITRSGKLVPVLEIIPTEISGAMITNVMAHNYQNVKTQKIKAGTVVSVIRSGEIIPFLSEVLENSEAEADIPKQCPFCDGPLQVKGVDLICSNKDCSEKNIFQIDHFFRTLGIESATKTTLEKLPINSILDVYLLTEKSFEGIKGFGEKKIAKILEEISKTRTTTKAKLLAAFGIPSLSTSTAEKIIVSMGDMDFEDVFHLKARELTIIDGIGIKNAEKIAACLPNVELIYNELKSNNIFFSFEEVKQNVNTNGKKYCFTGTGPVGRKELIALTEKNGHTYVDVAKADFLVCEDPNGTSSKLQKARQKGITLISYEDFMEEMK